MKVKEILNAPERWTQGVYARDSRGKPCKPWESIAKKFCLVGAARATYGDNKADYMTALRRMCKAAGFTCDELSDRDSLEIDLIWFNDDCSRTFEEVREVIEQADV
jgi:hypothetical protein